MEFGTGIAVCLWFQNGEAEDAANYYVSVFKNARILTTLYHTGVGQENHGQKAGTVRTVHFELNGQRFTGLNGGPKLGETFSKATSFEVHCEDQAEIDHYWAKLGEGGDPAQQRCGWLVDRFGVSWQVIPTRVLLECLRSDDGAAVDRVLQALFKMDKIDLAGLQRAFAGEQ